MGPRNSVTRAADVQAQCRKPQRYTSTMLVTSQRRSPTPCSHWIQPGKSPDARCVSLAINANMNQSHPLANSGTNITYAQTSQPFLTFPARSTHPFPLRHSLLAGLRCAHPPPLTNALLDPSMLKRRVDELLQAFLPLDEGLPACDAVT